MIRVHTATNGPMKCVIEQNAEAFEKLGMSKRKRNELMARGMVVVLKRWRGTYFKFRVGKNVLRPPFNYKGDPNTPMVDKGKPVHLKDAMYTGRVVATAPAGSVKGVVYVPLGHAVTEEISRVFKIIPPNEVDKIAEWLADWYLLQRQRIEAVRNEKANAPKPTKRRRLSKRALRSRRNARRRRLRKARNKFRSDIAKIAKRRPAGG